MLMQVAAQANPGSSVRMPQVLPDDARKKMKELVLTLFTFQPKHTPAQIDELLKQKNWGIYPW